MRLCELHVATVPQDVSLTLTPDAGPCEADGCGLAAHWQRHEPEPVEPVKAPPVKRTRGGRR